MAESSLSIGYTDLRQEVGGFLGYGRTIASWSAARIATIDRIVQSGVRQVYFPPAVNVSGSNEEATVHEWSWLRPTTTLPTVADDGDYDLPDDFGRLVGKFHYAANVHRAAIYVVSVGDLLDMRAHYDQNDAPRYVAIRYKASTGVSGQRQEALFWPEPDAVYTLSYEYEAYTGVLSDTYPYPLGGMQLAELYIESCLSIAEQRPNDEIGIHTAKFQLLLAAAVYRDMQRGARNFGQMGHKERYKERICRGYTGTTYPITYHGVDL
ncbi:MAG: hypothetical protein WC551_09485 [Patescibacteria group bacterium]